MSEIKIGNDDFILYIRKNQRADGLMSKTKNDRIGRMIWEFIRDNKFGKKVSEDSVSCIWNPIGCNDDGFGLPKNATQFYIDTSKVEVIYDELYLMSQR